MITTMNDVYILLGILAMFFVSGAIIGWMLNDVHRERKNNKEWKL